MLALADAVEQLLLANPPLAGGRIRRGRRVPVPAEWTSAIDVYVLRSQGEGLDMGGAYTRWDTSIAVDILARAASNQHGEQAVDELLADTYARLAAATPPQAAVRWGVQPAIGWEVDEADQTLALARITLRVVHLTGPASLEPATT